jgi:hypothetical protein
MRSRREAVAMTAEAAAMLAEMASWQRDHPRATLSEIEDEVDAQLARVRQQVVDAHLQTLPLADGERPICAGCGGSLKSQGRKRRTLITKQGGRIALERTYWWCPRCRAGLFPPG